ncbi:MarR family winged helix-turn-helix transcriptional regulator [Paenibacillus nasutitermitis]|uniref:MarR family transcriptional regulator n=1 Tax=Paenibacillus nasutitermitis TaxID=1652958 RepID=A0A917DY23_9BACL|nr:MarR family transcriptional regulator [Paenibacillus nasutitermitis]GGD77594.1 MarR family transcriptional regulator [Paenibacillus nasutitermitis]
MPLNEDVMEIHGLFKTLAKKITEEWNKQTESFISLSLFRMLYVLNHKGPQKMAELAECLHVTSGAITGFADKLIERGYVERQRDLEDRRVVYLLITDSGKSLISGLMEKQVHLYSRIVERLAPEDVAHLKRIFIQMIDIVNKTDEELETQEWNI